MTHTQQLQQLRTVNTHTHWKYNIEPCGWGLSWVAVTRATALQHSPQSYRPASTIYLYVLTALQLGAMGAFMPLIDCCWLFAACVIWNTILNIWKWRKWKGSEAVRRRVVWRSLAGKGDTVRTRAQHESTCLYVYTVMYVYIYYRVAFECRKKEAIFGVRPYGCLVYDGVWVLAYLKGMLHRILFPYLVKGFKHMRNLVVCTHICKSNLNYIKP